MKALTKKQKWLVLVVWLVLAWLVVVVCGVCGGCQCVHGLGMDIADMSEPYVKSK